MQRIVERASEMSGFPIALVSLVVDRVQLFKAHVGLPKDLAVSQATDRCNSFCQFVVASGKRLEIPDTDHFPELPQDLIGRYGIRAYVGAPVTVAGQRLGSLCLIDLKPHEIDEQLSSELELLAGEVSRRLSEMAQSEFLRQRSPPKELSRAEMALSEVRAVVRLNESYLAGEITLEEFRRGLGALSETQKRSSGDS